jgi:iron complex transport system permease protein
VAQAAKLPLTEAAQAAASRRRVHGRTWAWVGGGAVFALASVLVGVTVGPLSIGVGTIVESAASHVPLLGIHSHLSPQDSAVVWQIRLPRVVLGFLVGAMLACAGATYQGVFRNPLVDPYLLGVAAGAGLGATLMIVYAHQGSGGNLLPVGAFVGGSVAVVIAYSVGRVSRGTAAFALAGVTVTAFLTAIQTFVQQQHSDTLEAVYSWILGSLVTAGWHDVLLLLPYVAVSATVLLLHRRVLDVMTLDDEEASALGLNVGRTRLVLVAAATLGTAAAVAVVGGGFLVLCDVLARTVMSPRELPIGVVTAFFGAPFFAVVLRTSRSFAT